MNELEAMNMLLRLIGSSPVNNVETPHPDAANAKQTLDRVRRKLQRKGWWFSIEYCPTYTPNSDTKEIRIPATISSVVFNDPRITKRGNKLYDRRNNTYLFEEAITAYRQVRILEWDEMPATAQETAAYMAGAEFIRDELEDPQKEASLNESAAQASLLLKKQELEEGQYNVFNKARVAQARGGVRPYQRSNKRFYGDPDV
jgi:hypothetical protein